MARRKTKKSGLGAFGIMVLLIVAMGAGVAGGYAWRSHAPLPLPSPWGGDNAFAAANPPARTTAAAGRTATPTTFESAEITRLKSELDRLRQAQSETAQDLAEIQIKSVLAEEEPVP